MIFGLFGDPTAREAKQLNRDAPLIIEQAEQMFTDNRLREIVALVVEHREKAHQMFGRAAVDIRRAHDEYKKFHKDARQRNDQLRLTAMTLVIIHLRAELNGIGSAPARAAIDQFVTRWSEASAD
ncbi:MAG: hypothetical protein VW338_05785 [Rhodospirillaceae bacterium]|jgi:hypothetical protein